MVVIRKYTETNTDVTYKKTVYTVENAATTFLQVTLIDGHRFYNKVVADKQYIEIEFFTNFIPKEAHVLIAKIFEEIAAL